MKPYISCIPHKQYREFRGFRLPNDLGPGNYSFRICATTLIGLCNYTNYHYFYIADMSKWSSTFYYYENIHTNIWITSKLFFTFFRITKITKYWRNYVFLVLHEQCSSSSNLEPYTGLLLCCDNIQYRQLFVK